MTAVCWTVLNFAVGSPILADNWAHFRGPTGNSVAENANPPAEWNSAKNVKWKVKLPGRENSSPIVWDNQVIITIGVPAPGAERGAGNLPMLAFKVLSFDRTTGNLLWEQTATVARPHQKTHETNGFASASPCTDGEHIYAHFGSRGLFCYTMDGKLVWKRQNFGEMNTLNNFGEGSSPTLSGDVIIVPWDHQGPSAVHVLNKHTGETVWTKERDEPTCWATPLVVEHDGRRQIVMSGQKFARSYDLESGEELWRCDGQTLRPVASPVAANGLVYVGSGFQGAFLGAFRLDGRGDIKGTDKVAWTITKDMSDMASPLLVSGRIYFIKGKNGLLSCCDAATGKLHYASQRVEGVHSQPVYASPIAAGGRIYLTALNGTTAVIKDSDKLEIVAINPLDEWVGGTLAPVDNELFIRGEKHLYCIAGTK
jgi:outer membrane protein assembly factor BamB